MHAHALIIDAEEEQRKNAIIEKYMSMSLLDPLNDPILFQGELMKLKPGVKFEFQNRWI